MTVTRSGYRILMNRVRDCTRSVGAFEEFAPGRRVDEPKLRFVCRDCLETPLVEALLS